MIIYDPWWAMTTSTSQTCIIHVFRMFSTWNSWNISHNSPNWPTLAVTELICVCRFCCLFLLLHLGKEGWKSRKYGKVMINHQFVGYRIFKHKQRSRTFKLLHRVERQASSWNCSASQWLSPTVVQTSSSQKRKHVDYKCQCSILQIYAAILYLSQLGSASACVWGPKAHGWNKRDSNWIDCDHGLPHYMRTMLMQKLTIHTQRCNYWMRDW